MIKEIKSIEDNVDYGKLSFMGGNKNVYGLVSSKTLERLIKDILSKDMTIDRAETKQNKYAENHNELGAYSTRGSKYIGLKKSVSENFKKFYDGWGKMFMGLKIEYYHLLKRMI